MHLGFIISEYPHEKVNRAAGIATSIKNLVNKLVDEKIKVSLFIYHQDQDDVFVENGVKFHLIKKRSYSFLGWYLYRKHIQHYINKFIAVEGIDAIEAPDWTGITAFMKLKAPLVIRFHGSDTYFCKLEGRTQKKKNYFLEKNAISRAKFYIAPTTFAGVESARLFNIAPNKVTTIHYGLNLEHFVNKTPENYASKRLLNIGTIIRKKGVFQLAEMFNRLIEKDPKAELILIGADSPDLLTGSSSTWNLVKNTFSGEAIERVRYLGKIPYEDIKEHIKNAQVCVFPSLAETLGMVTIESMAMKKAVVNTNYGWAEELIDHQVNGYKIDPNNINAYVETIMELISNPSLTHEIGQAARVKVENSFDINKIVFQNIDFYRTLITQ